MEKVKTVTAPSSPVDTSSVGSKTRYGPVLSYLPAIFVVGLFVGGIGVLGHFFASKDAQDYWEQTKTYTSVVEGHEALAFEKLYKGVFPIRDFSTGFLNAISLFVFDEARKGLIKGSDGWFFTDEEFSWNRKSAAVIEKHMAFIGQTVGRLKMAGVEPIILLIPEKADIYRDKLGPIKAPASRERYYEDIRGQLKYFGVKVPDLRAAFIEARKVNDVFLRTDTHWTVVGAGVAATQIAVILRADDTLARESFVLSKEPEVHHGGDLLKFAKLSVFSSLVALPQETIAPLSAKKAEADLDALLDDNSAAGQQLALVGSSYSANATWSFEAQLKAATGVDVINFAEEGKGPFKPMETFLADKLSRTPGLKYLVWEVPLRYLDEVNY